MVNLACYTVYKQSVIMMIGCQPLNMMTKSPDLPKCSGLHLVVNTIVALHVANTRYCSKVCEHELVWVGVIIGSIANMFGHG